MRVARERVNELRKEETAAIAAVASHFFAEWRSGEDPPDAWLTIAGKRIAIEVTTMKHRIAGGANSSKPRLRFDKVALGLIGRLQTALGNAAAPDRTVIVTVTAPIKLAAKTAAALEKRTRLSLARPSARVQFKDTIHGNQIRVRVVKTGDACASKVIGFVHNPYPNAELLLDVTEALLECMSAREGKGDAAFAGERWLVIAHQNGISQTETYRQVCAQLSNP
jgi:hypothetical protein